MGTEITSAWAAQHMPRAARAIAALPDLSGVRMAMSMHLDLKMVPLVAGLAEKGAALFITTCNPATVRADVVAEMRSCGAEVQASRDMSDSDWQAAVEAGLSWGPTHLCEMGADFTHRLLSDGAPFPAINAGLEATGSGINRLQGALPPWPVFNWDDLPVKEGLHNRHMVGLTTWAAFFNRTLLSLHEKTVLVVGYGSVGQGLAASARAFGATVQVAERDAARLLQARYDGFVAGTLLALAPEADVIVTATGARHAVSAEVLETLKPGAFLLNAGHRRDEIEFEALSGLALDQPLPAITRYRRASGQTLHLFMDGAMANLAGGEGDSLNAFDVTLAVMAAGIGHCVGAGQGAPKGVHLLPQSVWEPACAPVR